MADKHQCCIQVSSGGQWGWLHPTNCSKNATIERDGKWYCKIHDPEYIKQKSKQRSEKWDKEWETKKLQWHRDEVIAKISSGFSTELLENNTDKIRDFIKTLEVK